MSARMTFRPIVFAFATALGLAAGTADARELMIYNASDGVSAPLVEAFKKAHPGINVKFVGGSTGPITERAIAEKDKKGVMLLSEETRAMLIAELIDEDKNPTSKKTKKKGKK